MDWGRLVRAGGLGCLGMIGMGTVLGMVYVVGEVLAVWLGPVLEWLGVWGFVLAGAAALFVWLTAAIYGWLGFPNKEG